MGKFTPAPRLSAVAGSAPRSAAFCRGGICPPRSAAFCRGGIYTPLRGFLPWRDLHPRSAAFCRGRICPPLRGFLPWRDLHPRSASLRSPCLVASIILECVCFVKEFRSLSFRRPYCPFYIFPHPFFLFVCARGCGAENGAERHRTGSRRPTLNGRRTNHTGTERAQNCNTARHRPSGRAGGPAANAARRCAFPCFPEKICI